MHVQPVGSIIEAIAPRSPPKKSLRAADVLTPSAVSNASAVLTDADVLTSPAVSNAPLAGSWPPYYDRDSLARRDAAREVVCGRYKSTSFQNLHFTIEKSTTSVDEVVIKSNDGKGGSTFYAVFYLSGSNLVKKEGDFASIAFINQGETPELSWAGDDEMPMQDWTLVPNSAITPPSAT